jgi:hypothetical protein
MKHLSDFVELRPLVIGHLEAMKKLSASPAGITIRRRR